MSNLFFTDDPGTIATNDPGGIFDGAEGIFSGLVGNITDIFKSRDARKLEEKRIDAMVRLNSPVFGGESGADSGLFGDGTGGGSSFLWLLLAAIVALIVYLATRKKR